MTTGLPYFELDENISGPAKQTANMDFLNPGGVSEIRAGAFNYTMFDPMSQQTFQSLNSKHMSGNDITEKVNAAGQELINKVHVSYVSKKENLSFTQLLHGFMYDGECLLSAEPHLPFLNFVVEEENKPARTFTAGTAIISNRRLLMMSSQYVQSFGLQPLNDPKKLPGGYQVATSCADSLLYYPIPLHLMRGIEVESSTGVAGSQPIWGKAPFCYGLFTCCGIKKTWQPGYLTYSERNETVLKIGTLIPPWQAKATLIINVTPGFSVHHLRNIVQLLQSNAPNLL